MKTRAIFVIYVLCLMGGIFFLVTLVVLTFLKTNIKERHTLMTFHANPK